MPEPGRASDSFKVIAAISTEQDRFDLCAPSADPPSQVRLRVNVDSIVERAASGDRDAFRTLYRNHRAEVARLVYRMVGATHDVDDVVQEVFLQVYRTIRDFRGDAKFSTWLHRLTVNVVLMHRRAARSRPTLVEETQGEPLADRAMLPDEDASRHERMRAFRRLLERISEKKRVVYILHDLEGMPPGQIAEVLEIPVLTVRTRLFYARQELEAMMGEEPSLAKLASAHAEAQLKERGAQP